MTAKMVIPQNIEDSITSNLLDLVGDCNLPENYASQLDHSYEEIEYRSMDGFIPFTNGGYTLSLLTDLGLCWVDISV